MGCTPKPKAQEPHTESPRAALRTSLAGATVPLARQQVGPRTASIQPPAYIYVRKTRPYENARCPHERASCRASVRTFVIYIPVSIGKDAPCDVRGPCDTHAQLSPRRLPWFAGGMEVDRAPLSVARRPLHCTRCPHSPCFAFGDGQCSAIEPYRIVSVQVRSPSLHLPPVAESRRRELARWRLRVDVDRRRVDERLDTDLIRRHKRQGTDRIVL